MRILFAGGARRSAILITSVIGALFLSPTLPIASAQQDEKEAVIKLLEKKLELQQKEFEVKLKTLELTLKQQQLLQNRLKDEIFLLNKTINDREELIVKLQADFKRVRGIAAEFEEIAKARQIRIERLLQELREVRPVVKEGEKPGVEPPRKAVEVNPPATAMEGKITKVDGAMVEITLGKDHGLKENHTLDAIRLQPAPKYLGTIRIVSVANTTAVGRLIGANPPALKEGDTVTSKLK